jgi:hypothetical protein
MTLPEEGRVHPLLPDGGAGKPGCPPRMRIVKEKLSLRAGGTLKGQA